MKNKPLLASLICASLNVSCSKSASDGSLSVQAEQQRDAQVKQQQLQAELKRWVGHYQADTPCITCTTFCDGCDGTHVDLRLDANQHYILVQQRNAEGEEQQRAEGRFVFVDAEKNKIQLLGVKQRHLIAKSGDMTEIYDQDSGRAYASRVDFVFEKI